MKKILLFSILFCAIAMPAIGALDDADLNKIRLIVSEEIKKETDTINAKIDKETDTINAKIDKETDAINTKIDKETNTINTKLDAIETRLRTVETGVAELRGRNIGFSAVQDWIVALCAVAAIILSIIALRKAAPKAPPTAQDTPKAVSQ